MSNYDNISDEAAANFEKMTSLMALSEVNALLERALNFCLADEVPPQDLPPLCQNFNAVLPNIRFVNGNLSVVSLWAKLIRSTEENGVLVPDPKRYWLVEVTDVGAGDDFLVFSDPYRSFNRGAEVRWKTIENKQLLARPHQVGNNFITNITANIPVTNHRSSAALMLSPAGERVSENEFVAFYVALEYYGFEAVPKKPPSPPELDYPPKIWSQIVHSMFLRGR